MAQFGPWDYTILAIVLLVSAAIGVYYRFTGGKQKTTREYLLADRSMSVVPVAFSLMASFMSAVTLLGVSAENYQYGTQFVIINLSYVVGTPVAVYLILPVFYRLKTASVYEYLELRFGYAARLCASLAFSLQMILYMGIVLYAPALALEAVTGLNLVFSIIIVGVVCTFYATVGGMKAVLVTDIFQSLLMFASIFAIIISAAIKADGLEEIWNTAKEGGRLEFFNFSVDPTTRHTFITQMIGGLATYLAIYGVNQTQVQRLLSVRTLKESGRALWWSLPILILLSVTTCFSGLCMYYYYKTCDPLLEGRITSRDQLMPLFVVDTMGHIPGISGLFVSGMFSASLSTISSAISSLAAVTLEDYIKPLVSYRKKEELSDAKTTFYSKLLSIIYGGVCLGLAFLAGSMGGLLQAALSIFGIIGGPLLGLFTLGMYFQKANQKGALTGLALSLAFSFWIGFGQPRPPIPSLPLETDGCPATPTTTSHIKEIFNPAFEMRKEDSDYFYLYRVSYMWYAVCGFLISVVIGWLSSWVYEKLHWASNDKIYTDQSRTVIKYDLFVPPIAKRIRQRQMPLVVVTASSEIGGNSSRTPSFVEEENGGNLNKAYSHSTELNAIEGNESGGDESKTEQVSASRKSSTSSGKGSMEAIPEEQEQQPQQMNGSIKSGAYENQEKSIK
ncbi:putative sodium-dependent multivitamin transporter [Musca domestica]|uniref:Sodium-dependent multivitamin transporter n=1 Tax=Musca domestica TaxID=7370 RepID=A0A9J7CY92_MUSDO|nr:putative sodium-dependent multivitamin transporter [Musca domestica]